MFCDIKIYRKAIIFLIFHQIIHNVLSESATSSSSLPKIRILSSYKVHYNRIDISSNDLLHLTCVGERPMYWIIPNNNHPVSRA